MTPRILHILDHSVPLHSGYTFRTLSILREQRKLGWETFHLTSPKQGDAPAEEDVDGLHFFRTPIVTGSAGRWPVLRELALMARLEKRIVSVARRVGANILHAHSPALNAIPALRAGRKLRLPVVYEVRAFWEDAAVDHGTTREGSLRYRLTRGMETWALRRVDQVTTICEGLRGDILARGIAPEKVTVVPNAVDVESFALGGAPDEKLRLRFGISKSNNVIGFIGSFYAYEGLDLLIEALPRVRERWPDACLLLIGGGPQIAALRRQVDLRGYNESIIFTGRVPHDDVQRYYDLIDVLAYPRRSMRLTELVTPLKPLEAMAQGRVLVASDVGGHRELIRDGETGVLFRAGSAKALAEAICKILAARRNWPQMREAARRYVVEERNWKKSVANYKQVYGRLGGARG
ncbi:MAG: glycosyltransferase, exosortase A system-associated [Candidatus Accumulibacter sp.]|jgi:PEP-CTERM/exosortase A-associated glycosyltransferase|nr:glycosyltransferase, exosortase A system-associated [Accumulibacter sp.]